MSQNIALLPMFPGIPIQMVCCDVILEDCCRKTLITNLEALDFPTKNEKELYRDQYGEYGY